MFKCMCVSACLRKKEEQERVSDSVLTEIFEGLLDLFCGQVEVDVG